MSKFYGKSFAFVTLVVGAALMAGAVSAQTAAPAVNAPAPTVADAPPPGAAPAAKPVAKPHKKVTPSVLVLVTNARAVALTELDATPADGGKPKAIVSGLAPGKKTPVRVAHGKSCVFDLHGAYADGSTSDNASVDLCKDKSINLID